MSPGLRTHKQASLRVAVPQALPVEMWEPVRELVSIVSHDRGKGHASALLHQVCAEADRAWITLMLHVEPFAEGMTLEQLTCFYCKFGFVKIQDAPCLMARSPVKPKVAH